jgi:hypothetical protein
MPAYARPMAFSSLLQQVKGKHDFDAFILGYGRLRLDPGYVRNLFHSKNDKPRGWNMSGYHNPQFSTISPIGRLPKWTRPSGRRWLWTCSDRSPATCPTSHLYKPSVVEAVRKDRFEGWVEMLEGIGNIWSMCLVKPVKRTMGLKRFIIRRLVEITVIFFVIMTVLFVLFRLAPGDPVDRMVDPSMTPEDAQSAHGEHGAGQARVGPVRLFT